MQGWIKLHRKIQIHELWQDKPFSRGQAWIDILLMVNHQPENVYFDGRITEVDRGSRIISIRKLCERWGWSNTKVISFLKTLQTEQMLSYKSDNKKTVLTVDNYDLYQNETTQKHFKNDTETTQKHTNKNDKNEKNDKKESKSIYAPYVKMTEAEYQKLITEYGEQKTKDMIEDLNNYKGSKGKRYASDYLTIRSWIRKDQKQQGTQAIDYKAAAKSKYGW